MHTNTYTDNSWQIRDPRGQVTTLPSLIHIAGALRHGTLNAEHEICRRSGTWKRLGDIFDVEGLLGTLSSLGHLRT